MRTTCHKLLLILTAVLFFDKPISAQETESEDAYGFWAGTMVTKSLGAEKKWNVGVLAQYHYISHEGVSKMDQVFARPSVSYSVLPWLRLHYDTDLVGTQKGFNMRFLPGVSVAKKVSDISLSLRHQFYYIWYPSSGTTAHLFTTKASAAYSIPETPLSLSVAMEPLYNDRLIRNRIFAGVQIRLSDNLTLCP